MTSIRRPPVHWIFIVQLAGLSVLLLAASGLQPDWLFSILAGGLSYLIPSIYFTFYAYRFQGARSAHLIARSFYRGEMGKYLLTLVAFGLTFVFVKPLVIWIVFTAYGCMLLLHTLATAQIVRRG